MHPAKNKARNKIVFLPLLALGLLLGACNILPQPQADTVRYFTLSPPPSADVPPGGVVLHQVQLAGHLRNRAMAVRVAENEVIYLDDVHWAEPLAEAFTQSLRTRLTPIAAEAVVTVQVHRFELVRPEGNSVQLVASYSIASPGAPVRRGNFTASPRTWDGKDYGALVGLMRQAVDEFGEVLAAALLGKK